MAPRRSTGSKMGGAAKAAAVLMSLDENISTKIFSLMNEEEIKEISQAMASLGSIKQETITDLCREFVDQLSEGGNLIGDMNNTKKLLSAVLGPDKMGDILEDIGGPAGRNTWDKLNNVNEEVLSSYLKNEYPQTAALVLSKIKTSQASRVLSVLPDDFALEVIQRMISMEPVKKEVLANIESTLQSEFMSNLDSDGQTDSMEIIAEVFNNFDRANESKFLELLDTNDPESAERIRELMFTFEDLIKIDDPGIQALLRGADKDKLGIALKGASDEIRDLFFRNMSERAVKIMKEDMEATGPVRMRDVDEAQMSVVMTAKELSESGEIVIPDGNEEDEEMIY